MSQIDDFLNDKPAAPGPAKKPASEIDTFLSDAPAPARGFGGWARDIAATAVKGAIAVPEAVVGLADIPTGGRVGKALENEGGAFGFRPKQAREAVNDWHSDATKEAQRKFQEADGIGAKFQTAIENPSLIATAVGESLPSIGAGGVVARGLMGATRLGQMGAKGAAAAGAIGEGATMAGSAAEQIRQETTDGLLTPAQAGAAVATGAAGAAFGYGGGRLAQRLGIGDADTLLAQGAKGLDKQLAQDAARAAANPLVAKEQAKSIPRQVIEGAISEGLFEELPQSVTEQVLQNLALGKDWHEDVDAAVVLGTLSGGAMGAGAAGYRGFRAGDAQARQDAAGEQPPAAPPAAPAAEPLALPAPVISVDADGEAATAADRNARLQRIVSGDITDVTPVRKTLRPSEALGLDPAAGPLTASAALAVDSGATDHMQAAQAQAAAEQMAAQAGAKPARQQPATGVDLETGEIAAAAEQAPADPAAALQERMQFVQQQAQASGWDKQLVAERNRVQRELARLGAADAASPAAAEDGQKTTPALTSQAPTATKTVAKADPFPSATAPAAAAATPAAPAASTTGDSLARQAQAIEASPQQQEAGDQAPADRAAAPAPQPVPAAGAPAGADLQAAGLTAPAAPAEFTTVKTVNGDSVTVRTADLAGDAPRLRQYTKDGKSKAVPAIHRDNLDATGAKGAALAKDAAANPLFNTVTNRAGAPFGSRAAAQREVNRLGLSGTHDVVPAGEGFVGKAKDETVQAQQQQAAPAPAPAVDGNIEKFAPETGTLGIPRADMPQVSAQSHGGLVRHLNAQGIEHETKQVDAASLKPTQAEYSPAKVEQAKTGGGDRAVIVSSDGHIIDGHHQALAAAEDGKPVKAIVLDAPVEQALEAVKNSPSAAPARLPATAPQTPLQKAEAELQSWRERRGLPVNEGSRDVIDQEIAALEAAVEVQREAERLEGEASRSEVRKASEANAARKDDADTRARNWAERTAMADERPGRPEAVSLPAAVDAALSADMDKQQARMKRLRTAAAADGLDLEAKKAAQLKVTAAEAMLRRMRLTRFDAEDAAAAAVKAGVFGGFIEHADLFPQAAEALLQHLQAGQTAPVDAGRAAKEPGTPDQINEALRLGVRNPGRYDAAALQSQIDSAKEAARKEHQRIKAQIEAKKAPADYGAKNTLVSQSRADELRAKLREKAKNHVFGGLDTEMLAWGTELAVFHLEAGVRKFTDFAATMAADLGASPARLKPYLRSWYNGARDMMEDHGLPVDGMDSPDAVRAELAKIEADAAPADAAGVDVADGATTMEPRTQQPNGAPNGNPDQAGRAADQGRAPEVPERGRRDHDAAAPADSGDLEAAKPQDVPAPADARRAGGNGVRVPAADVGRAGPAGQGRDAGDGRARAGRARAPDAGAREPASVKAPKEVSPSNPGPGNFHLDNPLEIVGGGPVARFDKNQAAIELLNALREEGRQATTEEQRTLAGYTGWGSFGQELFQGTWERPMPKAGWEARDRWLREHLGQQEWESAQRSITNAHYTDPPTVMAMWDMVRRMGFQGGRVLEPSMGIGNFFGMMPADLKGRSQLAGIELDQLTGSMAKLLYPQANVKVMGYQESRTPDDFYDVVIGNWPFENTVIADRRYNALSPYLHDYFFLKALDQVRPGGLVVGITSNGTMDKKATRIRAALARKAELVTAIRLPSGAFQEYAGTKVVTDIVILKKRDKALGMTPDDAWINTQSVKTPAGPEVTINTFYVENPGNVIGTTDWGHGTTRMQPGMIVHRPDNMAERLRQAVELVPQDVFTREARAEHISYITNHTADREGSLTEQDGQLFVVRGEHLAPAQEVRKYAIKDAKATAKREQQLRSLIDMRRKYAALIEAERSGAADEARTALRQAFEGFVAEHGALGDSFGLDYLRKIDDPFYPALAALDVGGKPSAILRESTTRGARAIATPTPQDAYVLARNKSVDPSLSEIAQIAGKSEDEVRQALVASGAVFEAPAGGIVPSDLYLAGNVRQKLREAQTALADGNAAMQRNVDALKAVVPADVPYFNIEGQLGATWVPAGVYAEYVAHMLNRPSAAGIEATFINGRWKVRLPDGANHTAEARTGYGTAHYPFSKLVNAAFTNRTVKITRKDSDGNTYTDTEATEEANARIADIRAKFAEWLWSDPERRVALEHEYNEARNAYATPKYDGSFLAFEGMALSLGDGPFSLRQHQVNAIWRALVNRRSLNAHEVGTGKTFTMGGIAVESRRYGIAKKPVILAHNANSATVAAEILQMYPAAKALYIDNLDKDSIAVRMRQIANDDWDAVVLPHSLIDRLSFREDTLMAMAREDIEALEGEAYEAAKDDGVEITKAMLEDDEELNKLRSVTAKELVKARNRIIETIKKQAMQSSREGAIPFEELGIDMVLVDEVHKFKKPPISTRMAMKGLNTGTSDRSIALQFVTRYIRANNFGGNVHTFTGTPITNTLTEVFHQMRYVMEDEMKAAGVGDWDGWFGSFAKEVQDVELSAAGEYEATNRLAGFVNVPELRRMVGQYMDVVFAEDMPEMQPRRVNGKTLASPDLTEAERAELLNGRTEGAKDRPYKKVINVTSDLTPEQTGIFAQLQGYARAWRSMTGKERKQAMSDGAPESPIITEGLANKASFDARLMHDERHAGQEGQAEDDAGSKASKVVANVLEVYNSDPRAAQVIFSEMGYSTSTERSAGRDAAGNKIKRRVKTFAAMRDVVERLVQGGIPREQIAMVTGSTSKEKRKEIALAMNDLRIRVVVGSTDTLGVGVNMQRNLRAMHHMDAPWMPGELEQRNGRGLRQGNQWNTVLEYRYMTDRLDGRRWQVLAIKQRFINAFMKAGDGVRVIEGDAASDQESDILQSFAEAAGDPRILIRAKLKKDVEALQRAERLHGNGVADARRTLRATREAIEWNRGILKSLTANNLPERLRAMMQAQSDDFRMMVQGRAFDARKDADEAVAQFLKAEMRMEQSGIEVGRYRDLAVTARWPSLSNQPELVMEVDGQEFASASLRGLEQQVRNFPQRIEKVQANIAQREAAMERLEQVAEAPFARAADLENAQKRLAALEKDIEINPVPPPAWLRAGAPMDSEAFRAGRPFVVTGHRWTADGWFVLGQDAKGEMAVPYMEVEDAQGMPLYDEREFQAPEVVEKAKDGDGSQAAPTADAAPFGTRQRSAAGTPTDRAVMDMVREGRDARDILRLVAGTSKSRFNRQVARLLLKTGIKPKVLLEGGALGGKDGFTFLAKYSRANNAISLTEGAQGQAEQIILHEMVHAATLAALDRKGLRSLQMRRLFEHVKQRGGAAGQYGMKNVGEFVAEAFTNPDFQRALQGMPAPVGGAIRNAWDGFVRLLRSILGLPQSEHSALSRALELGVAVMREDMALRQRGTVARGREAQAGIDQTQTEAFKRWYGDWQNAGHVPQPVEPNRGGAQATRDGAGAPVNGLQRPAVLDQDAARADRGRRFSFSGASGPTGADGTPVRLYHGTKDDVAAFDLSHPRRKDHGWLGEGVYLTSNLDDANQYARAKRGAAGPNLMPLYASVRNPYEASQADKQRLKQASKQAVLDFTERLKARGHDGVVLWDEGGDMELVAFAPTQVKSAIGNNGNFDPEDDDVSHFGAADMARNMGEGLRSITRTDVRQAGRHRLTDWLKHGLQFLGRRQLVDIYGDALPMREYDRLAAQMEADKNETGADADDLARRWGKLPDEGKLADLMHDATLAQIDADSDVAAAADDDRAKATTLKARFKSLTPEAQQVYRQARDSYSAHHAQVRDAIRARIMRSELGSAKREELLKRMDDDFFKKVKGVYFPLARFGKYVVAVKDGEGMVASVSRAETMAEAEASRQEMLKAFPKDKGFAVGRVTLDKEFVANHQMVGRGFMTDLYRALDDVGMDSAQLSELEDTLGQLYLSSLPDLSWAKHGIHRKGTPGFSQDARRAFAQNTFHGARYLAKLRYADLMQDELDRMQKHVDDWSAIEDFDQPGAQRVVDEMRLRHDVAMNPKSNPLSTALTSFGFVYYLGLSPAAAVVNLSQTALVAYPVMAGKWGYQKAGAALLRASKEAVAGKNDIRSQLKDEGEIAAYDAAVKAGVIDVTQSHDLAGIAQGEDSGVMWKIRPVMRAASFLFHHAERFNRQSTFIAAYRLARETGAAHQDAYAQAAKATYDGHFDYASGNRPRIMQGNVARVVLLFKQFAQNMIYTLGRQAYLSVQGESPEVRREARKVFAGLITTHAMGAGVLGLPLVGPLLTMASMLGGSDDEPWDAEVALRNMLAEAMGPTAAEVVAKGMSRLTPWDISGRIGLDKLIFPDVQEGVEGQRWAETFATGMLGPVVGMGVNAARAAQKLGDGDYQRALEDLLPVALRNPIKAARFASEGAKDRAGVAIKDEVGSAGVLGQAIGFSPSEVRLAQEGKSAVMDADRRLNERRAQLMGQFAKAAMTQDADGMREADAAIARFNEKNPGRRITAPQKWQSVRRRDQRIREAKDGVYLPRKRRDALEAGSFAFQD